jgi:lipoprotein-anchoring transpeptidase ErfK/SrfK
VLTPNNLRLTRAACALLAVAALSLSACSSSGPTSGSPNSVTNGSGKGGPPGQGNSASSSGSRSKSSKPKLPKKRVHIKLLNEDGSYYGVGMPVIAFFSRKIKDAKSLQDATTVKVNGQKMKGAWYFEQSSYYKGYPIEAHFRLENFWPAHAQIRVDIPTKGLSAGISHGKQLTYDDSLTLSFATGPRNISTVDDSTHMMTVTSDGKVEGTYPVSLGATATPTANGIKVIMEKGVSICMHGPGYDECGIKYTQRLTYGGEYLHSAPWNCTGQPGCSGPANNIGHADSSNGCTNLLPADAAKLYHFLRVGDVVEYPNASGPAMSLGAGYGDWNVSWGEWQTGGLIPTTT